MKKTLKDALGGLKKVSSSSNLSPTEKDLLNNLAGALENIEHRLDALERADNPAREIVDTPQGETAPLSR